MAETLVPAADSERAESVPAPAADAPTVTTSDLLVEEVSIDGMCGVY